MNACFKALQGRNTIAQGNALGTLSPQTALALKGRHRRTPIRRGLACPACFAPSGLEFVLAPKPRALPWAIVLRPFGAAAGAKLSPVEGEKEQP